MTNDKPDKDKKTEYVEKVLYDELMKQAESLYEVLRMEYESTNLKNMGRYYEKKVIPTPEEVNQRVQDHLRIETAISKFDVWRGK